jgi:hypothetical protein
MCTPHFSINGGKSMALVLKEYLRNGDGIIRGVVVSTGRGKVGWSFISPLEKVGLVKKAKRDREGNILEPAVMGISLKDSTVAEERANKGEGGPLPRWINRKVLRAVVGEMYLRSFQYFK